MERDRRNSPRAQTTTPIGPFKPLPVELLTDILELRGSWTVRGDFSSFSLVCSEWRPIAQRILFTEVNIGTLTKAQQFITSLRSKLLHRHGRSIRSLRLDQMGDILKPENSA
ncbi:hypothetical protein FRC03_009198 [Tulasnella sp. 419]|nr:hypothetical protein FRC03_009198 [Tulasnella sp. 419]